MKQLVIGDIHGRPTWKTIVQQDFDRVIFIGDYVDTHDKTMTGLQQLENLRDILAFKQQCKKEVICLIGNHDIHYWPGMGYTGTSGYQFPMAKSFEYEFATYAELFQMAFVDEYGTIFTHAGITRTWLQDVGIRTEVAPQAIVAAINDLFKHQPRQFLFYAGDFSHKGNNVHQSPIWVRPQSLSRDKIQGHQVVGHTMMNKIVFDNEVAYIDTLEDNEYLVIEDGNMNARKLEIVNGTSKN